MNTEEPLRQTLNPPPVSDLLTSDEKSWGAIARGAQLFIVRRRSPEARA